MPKVGPHVSFQVPDMPGNNSSAVRPRFRPIARGRETQVVAADSLPTAPVWSAPAKLGWGTRNSFRWTHHLGAKDEHRREDSRKVHEWLTAHRLTSGSRCLGRVDMETFDKLDIWSQFWWITEPTVVRLIAALNQNHGEHEQLRRTPGEVIHSALFEV